MADKALKQQLADVIAMTTSNTEVIAEVKRDNKMILEFLATIHQLVEDISKKTDEVLNAGAVSAKPKVQPKAKKEPKKKTATTKTEETPSNVKEADETPSKAKSVSKTKNPHNNIKEYFKLHFVEDPTSFDDILEENQAKGIYKTNQEAIDAKKEGATRDKYKATLVYTSLNANQIKKLKAKRDETRESFTNNEEDVEGEEATLN